MEELQKEFHKLQEKSDVQQTVLTETLRKMDEQDALLEERNEMIEKLEKKFGELENGRDSFGDFIADEDNQNFEETVVKKDTSDLFKTTCIRDGPKIKPMNFDGSDYKYHMWKYTLTRVFKLKPHWDQEQRLQATISTLRGSAAAWCTAEEINGTQVDNWVSLCDRLKDVFVPFNFEYLQLEKLAKLNQSGSVRSYVQTFRNVIASVEKMSDSMSISYFIKGLKIDVKRECSLRQFSNLEEAVHFAIRYEDLWRPTFTDSTADRGRSQFQRGWTSGRPFSGHPKSHVDRRGTKSVHSWDTNGSYHARNDRKNRRQDTGGLFMITSRSNVGHKRPSAGHPWNGRNVDQSGVTSVRCYKCGRQGHMARSCKLQLSQSKN